MANRRVGQKGQFDLQGRSHDAPDCGSYVLERRVGPNRWEIRRTAACDQDYPQMTVQFVSREVYDRAF